ncbi:GAF and ANTAR domain-containing protein [Actinoplanes sp. NPDC026619]|uniref:GAF and ANTAR domain-containing protein n=1 Tax=Actinoplanes sp. NPDC026619 TaxID=3155798 RepID=UPI0033F5D9E4
MTDEPDEPIASVESVGVALLSLADTLGDDFRLPDFLHQLTTYSVDLLHATGAGVMLAGADGGLRLMAASSEETRRLEMIELDNDYGPCVDAYRHGHVITHHRFDPGEPRWADLVEPAQTAGFGSSHAITMRHGVNVIGVLNLFCPTDEPLAYGGQRLGRMLADVATVGLLQRRALTSQRDQAGRLQHALTSRVIIEQAKGLLAERHDIAPDEAFRRLRQHARNTNQILATLARDVVDGLASLPPDRRRP